VFRPKNEIDAPELRARLGQVQVLDVREPSEFQAGHVEGSLLLPLGELLDRLDELDPDRPIVAVCRSGSRSWQVTRYLAAQGYDITNLRGGLVGWARHGFPLQAGPAPTHGTAVEGPARRAVG
jgi:rhodanese-related sulfurtransferase